MEKSIAIRSDLFTQINTLKAFSDQFKENKLTEKQFKIRTENLDKIREEFDEVNIDICVKLAKKSDDDILKLHQDIVTKFRELVFEIKDTMSLLSETKQKESSYTIPLQQPVKLPEVKLPKFNGDILGWPCFSTMFTAIMDQHPLLRPVQRLQYLLGCLSPDVLFLVKHLTISDANYKIAWDILVKRYDDPGLIVEKHVERILDLAAVTVHSYESLNNLFTTAFETIQALKAMKVPTSDPILLTILKRKLDKRTRHEWQLHVSRGNPRTVDNLLDFLSLEIAAMRSVTSDSQFPEKVLNNRFPKGKTSTVHVTNTKTHLCQVCKQNHVISACPIYLSKQVDERWIIVKNNRLCFNCLACTHTKPSCNSKSNCRQCGKRHHTSLHNSNSTSSNSENAQVTSQPFVVPVERPQQESQALATSSRPTIILLATACIRIYVGQIYKGTVRALLDSGSQNSFITEDCVQRLNLHRRRSQIDIFGLGQTPIHKSKGITSCNITPQDCASPSFYVPMIIIPKLTANLPRTEMNDEIIHSFNQLKLADPDFGIPGPVDVLLGADIFPYLLTGRIQKNLTGLVALETYLGYVITGKLPDIQEKLNFHSFSNHVTSLCEINETLKKFWEIEEPLSKTPCKSKEDEFVEEYYKKTTTRDISGRYIVSLPFKNFPPSLGDSYDNAEKCYRALKRRLSKNPNLEKEYNAFMADYEKCNHMSLFPTRCIGNPEYYIPHHSVVRIDSTTTKVRVVFNASKPTSNGNSLNETLFQGPNLLPDIRAILLQFREYNYVLISDVKQMYRQILVRPEDRRFQQILWNNEGFQPNVYQLNTVTYGMNCSPWLALRTIKQLADDEYEKFPKAAEVFRKNVYVDDVISGAKSLTEATELYEQLSQLAQAGGFELRKWSSNHSEIFPNIDNSTTMFDFNKSTLQKVLGLHWLSNEDCFAYNIKPRETKCTKRNMLSELARMYDPLGWLTPFTFFVKTLIQQLWQLSLGWDENPPPEIQASWAVIKNELPLLSAIRIKRHINIHESSFVGFCDASAKGYAAVIYSCSSTHSNILYARSRVAPIKKITIPRLELCAALLLAKMIKFLNKIFPKEGRNIVLFSDSSIVLSWLATPPHKLKIFEANRVAEIQSITPTILWRHICSEENIADVASRGLLPQRLIESVNWWHGPSWISSIDPALTSINANSEMCHEPDVFMTYPINQECLFDKLKTVSSFLKLLRIAAYVRRFIQGCRRKARPRSVYITVIEYRASLIEWIKLIQREHYAIDVSLLHRNRLCSKDLQRLDPFLEDGILKVGGRLQHSELPYEAQHPILLPKNSIFTKRLIDYYHATYAHVGVQGLLGILNKKYWISAARQTIRNRILRCTRCSRLRPIMQAPKMAALPQHRVTKLKPFEATGLDFGGPFFITLNRSRGSRSIKMYLCLFICFSTKAVHLEPVSDLSTEAFLSALKRFLSRRGRCNYFYSDCGTNFKGASRYINELQKFLYTDIVSENLSATLAPLGITWTFNPPSAPHFGGLWEAGIKSAKTFITKVIGEQILSYEEFLTVLTQIEAQLNSRPLFPVSSDPNDLEVLTPGHFLTNEPLISVPDYDFKLTNIKLSDRWRQLNRIQCHFWKRWHSDYLHTLQQRSKWPDNKVNVKDNSIVLIKEENTSPLQWKIGRILELYPGKDGITRVARVKTALGEITRPLVKLALLPTEPENFESNSLSCHVAFLKRRD